MPSGLSFHQDMWLGKYMEKDVWHARLEKENAIDLSCLRAELKDKSFVDIKLACGETKVLWTLQAAGFRVVDTNLTFSMTVKMPEENKTTAAEVVCREAVESDEIAIRDCARDNFVYSRFHLDPLIPKKVADTIKGEWAGNFFCGKRGDRMLVAESEGRVMGFCQMLEPSKERSVIDLIAVEGSRRRMGVGKALIESAARHCGEGNILVVGTQVANIPSVRLYERAGFRLDHSQYVLHRHSDSE